MSVQKQILLAPRYTREGEIDRVSSTATLSDYFIDCGFLPVMGFFDTKFKYKEEAMDLARKYLSFSSALVLQGGNDICPTTYQQLNQRSRNVAKFRDVFELALIEVATERGIPILGICRGMQILNVFFGGSLYQDLDNRKFQPHLIFKTNTLNSSTEILRGKVHTVELSEGGELREWVKKAEIKVNSEHHQGICKLGQSLNIEAMSPDGLIEAFSSKKGKILGLQWHPELDLNDADEIRILNSWIEKV